MLSRSVGQSSPTEIARKAMGIRTSNIAVVCENYLLVWKLIYGQHPSDEPKYRVETDRLNPSSLKILIS